MYQLINFYNLYLRLIDHTTDVCNYAYYLYDFNASFGRLLPFTKSDALLIFFLHDLEKPWRIEVLDDGTVRNRLGLYTKEAFKQFREDKLVGYGILLRSISKCNEFKMAPTSVKKGCWFKNKK